MAESNKPIDHPLEYTIPSEFESKSDGFIVIAPLSEASKQKYTGYKRSC